MKVSFVTTVLNEEKTIGNLLDSLIKQTRKPDEIIIVDGGSSDKTVEQAKKFQANHPTTIIYIIVVKGANRAKGRNEGIRKAKGEVIAISDAGCELEKDWLDNIIRPFSPRRSHRFTDVQPATIRGEYIDAVAGYYKPITTNVFQECLACYTSVMEDRIDPENFLPSSRSIAFRKTAWKRAGGYPENLDYCEDLVFARDLKDKGFKFVFAKDALVYWPQKKNLWQAFWQFFNYASGDAQALYWPHLRKIALVYLRYLLGIGFLVLWFLFIFGILGYLGWAVWKNYRYVKHPLAFFYLPILQVTADLAVMSGTIKGLLSGIIEPKVWDFYRRQ